MTTPLQQAAQALLEHWYSPNRMARSYIAEHFAELRKALDAELRQSVEPVGYAYAHQDFVGSVIGEKGEWAPHEIPLYLHPLPADDFDTWQKNPYTLVLQKSIAEDYVQKHAQQAEQVPMIEEHPAALAVKADNWGQP